MGQVHDKRKMQFRLAYSELEDRVLFTGVFIDGTQVNLWLTRRLVLGLMGVARKFSDATAVLGAGGSSVASAPAPIKQEIASFQREAAVRQADFDSPFVAGEPHKDLGTAPLLVNRVSLVPGEEGAVTIHFGLTDRRDLSFPVTRETFLTLWNMLERLVKERTDWLSDGAVTADAGTASGAAVMH